MPEKTAQLLKDAIKAENDRKFWLRVSGFVCIIIVAVIWNWDFVQIRHLQWVVISFGLTISAIWWYWTMRLIRLIITQRIQEIYILNEVIHEIRSVKNDVENLVE